MPVFRWFAVAGFVVALNCSGGSTGYSPPPPPPAPPPPPPSPGPTLSVSVEDNAFNPSNGPLQSGGQVTWTWNGTFGHNVTFEDSTNNSGTRTSGTHQRTFPTVSSSTTFRYRCTLHSTNYTSGMVGRIVVTP